MRETILIPENRTINSAFYYKQKRLEVQVYNFYSGKFRKSWDFSHWNDHYIENPASITGKSIKYQVVSRNAIKCYLVLFSVIYYILLGLTEIIKFLFGHFFAVNIYSYIMKQKMKAIPFKHAWWNAVVFKRWLSFCFHI